MIYCSKQLILALCLISLASCSLLPQRHADEQDKKELEEALKGTDVPSMESTLQESGDAALANGDSLKAEYYFNQLVKKSPDNPVYKYKLAEALRRRGDCNEALPLYDDVLKAKADNMDAREGQALCLVSTGEFQKAGPILTDIIQRDPSRWKSINAAGLIFAINNKFKEANQYFDLASDVSNHNPSVLNNQALVRALIGNNDDAIKILKDASLRAGEGTAQKRDIDLNLAMVYGISRNIDMAEATAKPWLTTPQLYNNMGIYAELGKDPELARTYLNKALMGTPVYYDRAWDNLERLDSGNGGSVKAAPADTVDTAQPAGKTVKAKQQ
jgi:Flp pilus assembly protein TadD